MKVKGIKKILIGILSIFLIVTCFLGISTMPGVAYASSSSSVVVYSTTDKKPTYTATLNENNILLKEIEDKLNGVDGKKENKVLANVRKYDTKYAEAIDLIFKVYKNAKDGSSSEIDFDIIGTKVLRGAITAIASAYGFGPIANSIFNGLESIFTSGEKPLSEIEILTDNINQQFGQIKSQLYDIEREISSLSNEVNEAVDDILGKTEDLINKQTAEHILRAFMSRGEGNFSYNEYRNYIYGLTGSGNSNKIEAYYNQLMEATVKGADDDMLKYYYDKLFDAVYSNKKVFEEYYFGEATGLKKSITKYYYDYLLANKDLIENGKTAESMAIEFAYDMYSTYVYSYEIIRLCYSYQTSEMYIEEMLKGQELSDYSAYQYNDRDIITYQTIKEDLKDFDKYYSKAEEMVVSDLAYILDMHNSYIAVDKNGDIHDIGNYGDSFGNVTKGQTIYLNKITDQLNDIFELDSSKYSFVINGQKKSVNDSVIDTSNESGRIVATAYYGSTQLYSIEFTIDSVSSFSGGSGSYDDPYLISNESQFQMMSKNNEPNACYKLIKDNIDLSGIELDPIGTFKAPFNGVFDGNGYVIKNIKINSLHYDEKNITLTPTTGLFGTIGVNGIVENLTIENLTVISNSDNDGIIPENDTSSYYIGGIAGYNKGVINNCTIKGNSSITVDRNIDTASGYRNVNIYVGGITGNNEGKISYCSVEKLTIDAKALMHYHGGPDEQNKLSLYVGGITATTNSIISNCRVSSKTNLSAYAKSIAKYNSNKKPYVTVRCGGIIAEENGSNKLQKVYSDVKINSCQADVYNDGTVFIFPQGKVHKYGYNNASEKVGKYYPVYYCVSDGETLNDREKDEFVREFKNVYDNLCVKYTYDDESGYGIYIDYDAVYKELKSIIKEKCQEAEASVLTKLGANALDSYDNNECNLAKPLYNVEVKFEKEIKDGKCALCGKENCNPLDDLIYEINSNSLNATHMNFYVNGRKVDAKIVGYYGLDTYNEAENSIPKIIKIFFVTTIDGENVTLSTDVDITVKGDREISEPEIVGIRTSFTLNSGEKSIFDNGVFRIIYHYASGDKTFIIDSLDDIKISNFDTSKRGDFEFIVEHNGNKIKQKANVSCSHQSITQKGNVSATCQSLGYEIWICNDCGCEIHKNYTYGEHQYCVEKGKEATCSQEGFTDKVICSVCGKEFRASEAIQKLPHNYMTVDEAKEYAKEHTGIDCDFKDSKYDCANYHFCVNGNHYEPHQFTVTIGSDKKGNEVYIYTCKECGYEGEITDKNIIKPNDKITTITVSQGYALQNSEEATVYVYLDNNNEGFYGASFGIRYDERLTWVKFEEGSLNTNKMKVEDSQEVYHGYNFIWANDNKINGDGTLLKITFAIPYDAKINDVYDISIVYGLDPSENEGGFCITDDYSPYNTKKFMAYSGSIKVVEHLPGDVDGNGNVDIMDAMKLSWAFIKKKYKDDNGQEKVYVIEDKYKQYADVNLSGGIDIQDIVWILQSVSGDFGTNLLYPEYFIKLNLNVPNDGFDYSKFDDEYILHYNKNGTALFDKSGNIVSLDYIKENMLSNGYTFDGLYLTLFGDTFEYKEDNDIVIYDTKIYPTKQEDDGKIIKLSFDELQYVPFQRQQTLYARWSKNAVKFDLNGGTSATIKDVEFQIGLDDENNIILKEPTQPFTVDFIVDGVKGNTLINNNDVDAITESYISKTISREFSYWEDQFGVKYYAGDPINLCNPNKGILELKAVWGDYSLTLPEQDGRIGYQKIEIWYLDPGYQEKYTSDMLTAKIDDLKKEGKNTLELYARSNYVEYTIEVDSDSIKDGFDYSRNSTSFTIGNLNKLRIDQIDDSNVVGYSFKHWIATNGSSIDYSINNENKVSNIKEILKVLENNIIIFKAAWTANEYYIRYEANKPENATSDVKNMPNDKKKCKYDENVTLVGAPKLEGWTFMGWYYDAECLENNRVGDAGATLTNPLTATNDEVVPLYAKWAGYNYNIKFNYNNPSKYSEIKVMNNFVESQKVTIGNKYDFPKPTCQFFEFVGWEINSNIYLSGDNWCDILGDNNLIIEAKAKWSKSEIVSSYTFDTRDRSIKINPEYDYSINTFGEDIRPEFNKKMLLAYGYTKIQLDVTIGIAEIDDGYQYVTVWANGKKLSSQTIEHNQSGKDTNWGYHYFSCALSLIDLPDNCSFALNYSAYGKGDDAWKLGRVVIRINVI